VILRFEGGPLDGKEETSDGTPHLMFRTPLISEMMLAVETADPGEEPPDFGATYELVGLPVGGVARYRLAERAPDV